MNQVVLVLFLAFIIAVNAEPYFKQVLQHQDFDSFKLRHGKVYSNNEEHEHRKRIFNQNKHHIRASNELYENGKISFKSGTNEFSDMTHEEFRIAMHGYKPSNTSKSVKSYVLTASTPPVPLSFDWRQKGAVTPVNNQQKCKSCWAFGAAGALEAQMLKKTGHLIPLSVQNLVDCSGIDGNHGCSGGCAELAFDYVRQNDGIDTAKSYPYTAMYGKCHYNASSKGFEVKGYVDIPHGDENALTSAIYHVGPVAAAIDSSNPSFQHYSQGIYEEPNCDPNHLTHTILIVGYGSEGPGRDYYIVKNSWGLTWGENGYVKMKRNSNNSCGIASQATYPHV